MGECARVVVLISANIEWKALRTILPEVDVQGSPYGEWFVLSIEARGQREPVVFFHGGWGKISAAASTQYAIDQWDPILLVNLGTCGGFEGEIERGTILLAENTLVYDIIELMGDFDEHIAFYSTRLDLSWLGVNLPLEVKRSLLVSADRDLMVEDIPQLKNLYGAVAADWESGAVAFVASRNQKRCLILRGVTDLVGSAGGEAYDGNIQVFVENTTLVLRRLVDSLPAWINLGLQS